MKETGIIMSGDHPRKILDNLKTQTRRTYGLEKINEFPDAWTLAPTGHDEEKKAWLFWQKYTGQGFYIKCPYGHIGDLIWGREAWAKHPRFGTLLYRADGEKYEDAFGYGIWKPTWTPSIHMPRKASRISRPISLLRPERLQDISWDDAVAEAVSCELTLTADDPIEAFAWVWDSLNAKRGYGWDKNPWVWVIGWPKYSTENTGDDNEKRMRRM